MLYLANNIRVLRRDQELSQEGLAKKLMISRASLAKYEGGINEPSLAVTLRISRYFNISVDVLLTVDLNSVNLGWGKTNNGLHPMMMPVQVDTQGSNMIEIVPHSAQAGYTGRYSDPGFIEELDQMALPFQELHGKCRAFPIEGDSMPPYEDGSFVIGRQVTSREDILDNKRCIIVSRDEGIVFKRIYWNDRENGILSLHSDNPKYDPFLMPLYEILEIWEFVGVFCFPGASDNYFNREVLSRVKELQDNIQRLAQELTPKSLD